MYSYEDYILQSHSSNWKETLLRNGRDGKKTLLFMTDTEYDGKTDTIKTSLLLHCIGDKAGKSMTLLTFDAGDELKYDKIIEKLEAYLAPRKYTFLKIPVLYTHKGMASPSINTQLR